MARRRHTLITDHAPNSAVAEAYRMLRTGLMLSGDDDLRSIAITSGERGEGKSLTSANLAIIMSRDDRKVVLLDADLRIPAQHEMFGLPRRVDGFREAQLGVDGGLVTEQLIRERYAVPVSETLHVITAGPVPPDPSETLGSTAYARFFDQLLEMYDVVVVDTPPVGRVTDAAVVSRLVDGMLLVVDYRGGRRRQSRRAVQSLKRVGAPLIGSVVNRYDRDELLAYGEPYSP